MTKDRKIFIGVITVFLATTASYWFGHPGITGMYGMNVDERWMPLAKATHGFGLIGIMTVVICAILALFLKRHRMM